VSFFRDLRELIDFSLLAVVVRQRNDAPHENFISITKNFILPSFYDEIN